MYSRYKGEKLEVLGNQLDSQITDTTEGTVNTLLLLMKGKSRLKLYIGRISETKSSL